MRTSNRRTWNGEGYHTSIALAALLSLAPAQCAAQADTAKGGKENPPNGNAAGGGGVVAARAPSLARVRVVGAGRVGKSARPDSLHVDSAGLGDIIVVSVQALTDLVNRSHCLSSDGRRDNDCKPQEIALFLDGREIKGIAPENGAPLVEDGVLQFHLARTDSSSEAWADLLGKPSFRDHSFFTRKTPVSVGLAGGAALPSMTNEQFVLIRVRHRWFRVCSVLLLGLLGLLAWLSVSSDIIRDNWPAAAGRRRTYSLGRFQMAIWFGLVITAFVYIWLITGDWNSLTPTVLGLIGIGAGTALGAAAIDNTKRERSTAALASLQAEEKVLVKAVATIDTAIAAAGNATAAAPLQSQRVAKAAQLQLVRDQIGANPTVGFPMGSQGFLKDILTDHDDGYSFHRFQMFVWTLVLAILFVYAVWSRLAMPEFNALLLALLGLSGGTYLGFKIPEKTP